jgi:hypothetical protein
VTEFECALSQDCEVVIQIRPIPTILQLKRCVLDEDEDEDNVDSTVKENDDADTISATITLPRTVIDTMLLASDTASPEK